MLVLKFFKWRLRIGRKPLEMYTPEMFDWIRKNNKKRAPVGGWLDDF
jgi:hypothetical protein